MSSRPADRREELRAGMNSRLQLLLKWVWLLADNCWTSFAAVLRRTLVQTFTDGLVSMGTCSFEILASIPPQPQSKRAKVTMQVTSSEKVSDVLDYSLALDDEGSWRVRNFVFDGVNIGLTFRNQFDSEVADSAGSIEDPLYDWEIAIDQ